LGTKSLLQEALFAIFDQVGKLLVHVGIDAARVRQDVLLDLFQISLYKRPIVNKASDTRLLILSASFKSLALSGLFRQ